MMKVLLGIDWGGTYIKAGLVNNKGKILRKVVYASGGLRKKQAFISTIRSLVGDFKKFDIKAIGIGAPGIINTEKGFIYSLTNVPGWKNFPLKETLSKKLKIPVFVNNDANVFALAESRLGAACGYLRSISLTLGTGLGGAVISGGKLLRAQVSSLELGHVPIALGGPRCSCGGRGCIETFVGNKYLLKRYKALKGKKAKAKEVKDIFEKAQKGEKEALAGWEEFSHALGKFLSGMINIFNPQVIVFGGGVSGAFKLFKPLVSETIKKQAMWPQAQGVKLLKAKLKDSGIIGAALWAKENLES